MWGSPCIPRKVDQGLSPLTRPLRCVQAQHVLVCCWLRLALRRDPGTGTRQGRTPDLPPTLPAWPTGRMSRSGPGEVAAGVGALAPATLRALPPPAHGVWSLRGESPGQAQRGRQHPWGHTTRHSAHAPSPLGGEGVLRSARGGRVRGPVALAALDPTGRGPQTIRWRQRLTDFVPPNWARHVVVMADAGCAAHAPRRLRTAPHSG